MPRSERTLRLPTASGSGPAPAPPQAPPLARALPAGAARAVAPPLAALEMAELDIGRHCQVEHCRQRGDRRVRGRPRPAPGSGGGGRGEAGAARPCRACGDLRGASPARLSLAQRLAVPLEAGRAVPGDGPCILGLWFPGAVPRSRSRRVALRPALALRREPGRAAPRSHAFRLTICQTMERGQTRF